MSKLPDDIKQAARAERRELYLKNPYAQLPTTQQREFIKYYCDRAYSRTFQNKIEAMRAAGYKACTTKRANEIISMPHIAMAMDMYAQERQYGTEITRQNVLDMLMEQYNAAKEKGDTANAIRVAESFARINGMFNDKLTVSTEQQEVIDTSIREEMEALSKMRVSAILGMPEDMQGLPALPAPAEEEIEDAVYTDDVSELNDDVPPLDKVFDD